jgi:hypothetical protein
MLVEEEVELLDKLLVQAVQAVAVTLLLFLLQVLVLQEPQTQEVAAVVAVELRLTTAEAVQAARA